MHYTVNTLEEKIICKYTGYTFKDLEELTVFEYWALLRDAVIYNYMNSEDGKEYLRKCWCMEQIEPDRKELRKRFKRN